MQQFEKELNLRLHQMDGEMETLRRHKAELEAELRRLTTAVAEGGHSAFLLEAIAEREKKLREITDQVLGAEPGTIQAKFADLRRFVHSRLSDLRKLLYADVASARIELAKHVSRIVLRPEGEGNKRHYVAVGDMDLIGKDLQPERWWYRVGCGGWIPATFGL